MPAMHKYTILPGLIVEECLAPFSLALSIRINPFDIKSSIQYLTESDFEKDRGEWPTELASSWIHTV